MILLWLTLLEESKSHHDTFAIQKILAIKVILGVTHSRTVIILVSKHTITR